MPIFDYQSIPLRVIPSPPDERDYKITRLIPAEQILTTFPDSFAIPYSHDVENQGSVGACTWHSYCYCREVVEEKQSGKYVRLSPASGYLNRLDTDYQGSGEYPREGLNTMVRDGIADWDTFPFNLEYPAGKVTWLANKDAILKSALPHRITAYASVSTVDEIKNALMLLGPVTIDIPIYSSFYGISKDKPVCPIPNTSTETLIGYHMVTILGWRADGTWIILNSWGSAWGDNGYFYLPFNYQIMEAYSMTDNILPGMSTPYDRTNATILVVHYLGDGQGPVQSKSELLRRANPYGYDYPEYDFGIIADGTIIPMRPLTARGAHCISDIPAMMHDDPLWWNKNSISIVIGVGDGYVATDAQLKALSVFIRDWLSKPSHIVYRHCNITRTDCPNLSEETWNKVLKGYDDVLDTAVLLFTKEDYWSGTDVSVRNSNCAIFIRPPNNIIQKDAMSAKKLIVIGGASVGHPNETLLSGNTKYDTAAAVARYLG